VEDFLDLPKKECHRVYLEKSFPPLTLGSAPNEIFRFVCVDCGKKDANGKCVINAGGRRAYWRSIRAFFNWAYSAASGIPLRAEDNPVKAISQLIMKTLKTGNRILPAVTSAQVKTLLDRARSTTDPVRNRALLAVFYESGGRLAAVGGIDKQSIDFTKHMIQVREKGDNQTWVVIGKLSEKCLREWLSNYDPSWGNIWGLKPQGIRDVFRSL
jgi:integrase